MKKKGQLDYPVITFFVIVLGLLILAPIMLKIFISVRDPISAQFGNMSTKGGTLAQTNFNAVMNTAVNFWDKVIISAFFLALILLVISSLFIDTHPLWVVLYIFISLMLVLFAPDIVDSLSAIYDSPTFVQEVSYLTFMDSLRTHFGEFLVGVMVFTGILIYGKIRFFGNGGGQRR